MKTHIHILLLLISSFCYGQNQIILCEFENYAVEEFDGNFLIKKGDDVVYKQSNKDELKIVFNEKRKLLFINSECNNCDGNDIEKRDFTCPSNETIEIIPINNVLRIVNDFQFSKTCFLHSIKSKRYPDSDSLTETGEVIYYGFEKGYTKSRIISIDQNSNININPALKYYKVFDLVLGIVYNYDDEDDYLTSYLTFNQFQDNEYVEVKRIQLKYSIKEEESPFSFLNELSDSIQNYQWLNSSNFAIQVQYKWFHCSYNNLGVFPPSLNIDTNKIDSIQIIDFFSAAQVYYYPDSTVLNFSHQRISGKVKINDLIIKNYYAEGIEPYVAKEIAIFTFSDTNHIIVSHWKGYPRYGKFEIKEAENPLDLLELDVHILDTIPRNVIVLENLP